MEIELEKSLEKLLVWNKTRALRIRISQLVKRIPDQEKLRLSDQMIRCSRSISANIAEGYGRFHFQDSIRFYIIARGSLIELLDHLYVCIDENFITQETFNNFREEIYDCLKMLNGYIKYVRNQIKKKPPTT
ncbi:MAG: four helix bundle protein [Flavobacteriales bacterium]|nr:four helix bundle protein [Flavobacteriales bacterium]